MIIDIRTAIKVGNSTAVTLPPAFIQPGKKIQISQQDGSLVLRPMETVQRERTATNEEVLEKFQELEHRYGKLYNDLAHVQ